MHHSPARGEGQGEGAARAYAQSLLASLNSSPELSNCPTDHPATAWSHSGLMALTGAPDGPPQMCPVPLASCADGALAALCALQPGSPLEHLRGARLLAERAAMAGLKRLGAVSPGGACRLLSAADGRIALTLARGEDWALLPAWLESGVPADWDALGRAVRERPVGELLERGRLLGLAIAPDAMPGAKPDRWHCAIDRAPLVVDLSSLWAGPLCSQLLHHLGAEVVKVESPQRPDGARRGAPAFFDLLNAGKSSVALDLRAPRGREQLRALLRQADIVIESSRPRALRQLGVDAEALLDENPALTWIAIGGYGRGEPFENWIAYGDDAGVAAGLSAVMRAATGLGLFCGDAVADPLTGLHAALAAWAGYRRGGGGLISLSLCGVVRNCVAFDQPPTAAALRERQREWSRRV
ncbi:MAG: CoA transferase, partial [Gammaproteobacteria bacterium]|nr:CoA transferase [Gammaproteobacteria bacterium]